MFLNIPAKNNPVHSVEPPRSLAAPKKQSIIFRASRTYMCVCVCVLCECTRIITYCVRLPRLRTGRFYHLFPFRMIFIRVVAARLCRRSDIKEMWLHAGVRYEGVCAAYERAWNWIIPQLVYRWRGARFFIIIIIILFFTSIQHSGKLRIGRRWDTPEYGVRCGAGACGRSAHTSNDIYKTSNVLLEWREQGTIIWVRFRTEAGSGMFFFRLSPAAGTAEMMCGVRFGYGCGRDFSLRRHHNEIRFIRVRTVPARTVEKGAKLRFIFCKRGWTAQSRKQKGFMRSEFYVTHKGGGWSYFLRLTHKTIFS